ncbi:MAG: glycosyltransferase [Chlorobiaceae bacterium]|nr:glycosyltransferase [Chlorobiaceae bacterium]NTV26970.1 glycosyltransferase [Chlorobiaceae bacterium]
MNFLFLNSASRGWGGNEKSIILAAEQLSAHHGITLAYRSEEIGKHASFTKYQLPFRFEGDLYTIAHLVSIVRKHRIDVIIPSKRKDYVLAGIVSRLCGISNIIWLGALRELKNSWINRLVYGTLADGIIVNADCIRQKLIGTGFIAPEKTRVVFYGLDTRALDLYRKKRAEKSGKEMLITAAGRLDKNKNHAALIRAFSRFLAMRPGIEAKLQILGEGPERSDLQKLITQLGLEDRVALPGFSHNPYQELVKSDVFVMTSVTEGLSIALLEAMYLGNAPISTLAGGGVMEIIENGYNGFLIQNGDEIALASLLLKFNLEPDLRQRIAESAWKSVAHKYAAERITREIADFCQEVRQD